MKAMNLAIIPENPRVSDPFLDLWLRAMTEPNPKNKARAMGCFPYPHPSATNSDKSESKALSGFDALGFLTDFRRRCN